MKMPTPMATRLTKLILAISAIFLLGIILGIATKDKTLLLLSIAVAVAGAVKIVGFLRTFKESQYECMEGLLIAEQASKLRKRHTIIMETEHGELRLILDGRHRFVVGKAYRIYLKKDGSEALQQSLPEQLLPGRVVLGYEEMSLPDGKQNQVV